MKLWAKIFLALTCGVLVGILFGVHATILNPIGSVFLKLLNMLIVPLIFASMVSGISHISDTKGLGRIGTTTLSLYAFSTLFAVFLGLGIAIACPVGSLLSHFSETLPQAVASQPVAASHSICDIFLSMIPKNPIKAFSEQNIVQIIVFAIFFGIALNMSGEKGKPMQEMVDAISYVMRKMTSLVMKFSPIGVFALMATAVGGLGIEILIPVALFLLLYYAACLLHIGVVFCPLIRGFSGLQLAPFFKGSKDVILATISTCSSSASLPIAIECATERLGVSRHFANFVLPIGCSLNMNGSALFQTMAAVFIADAYGIPLTPELYGTIACTVLLATIGTASIPGGGFMMLSIVLAAAGIPLEGLALIAGIDRLRDMGTTTLNVLGDIVCAVAISEREGDLKKQIYYSEETKTMALSGIDDVR